MGQLGSNLQNSNVVDPRQAKWGDLDTSEKSARIIGGATTGLAKGFQNQQQQSPYRIPNGQNTLNFYGG